MSESVAIANQPWTRRVLAQGAASKEARRIRLDSWTNMLTGLGTARDKTTHMLPGVDILLNSLLLEILYHSSDIAARIVSALPDECFKKAYKVVSKTAIKRARLMPSDLNVGSGTPSGDGEDFKKGASALPTPKQLDAKRSATMQAIADNTDSDEADNCAALESDLNLLGAREKQHEAMTWGRLYGLGGCLIGADDGNPAWMPLDWEAIRSVDYITVLDKRDLIPFRWYANPLAPKFGDIALYQVQPVGVYMGVPWDQDNTNNTIIMCHESRLIRFGGELTSKRERLRNQGADYSVLQKCYRALQLVDNNWQSASALLADASQAVIKIKGLMDMISQEPDLMQERMALVDQMRSVVRALVLDADGEEFERKGTPFAGIPEMLEQTWTRVASAARMPKVILMGSSTKGLGDTGDSEIRWWYDTVSSTQERQVRPAAEYQLRACAQARGLDPEEWSVVFPPLWNLTEKEQAEVHFTQAQADQIYIVNGVATAEEIALSRFANGEYSLDTKIDEDSRRKIMALGTQQAEIQASNDLENAINPPPPPKVVDQKGNPVEPQTPDPGPPGNVEN